MSQACVPASPPSGQRTTHCEPCAHVTWQGGAAHVKLQVLLVPQSHWPFAQVPVQVVFVEQLTWQGGALQLNAQVLPGPQEQVPFAHSALQDELSPSQRA
jgi:hypothetical protein